MDLLKSSIENIEKICKYVSFGTLLLFISIGSFIIWDNDIKNVYIIVGIYSGCLFISYIVKIFGNLMLQLFSHYLWGSSKSLSKLWFNLSDAERNMLVKMYYSEDKSLEVEMTSRTILLLEQRNLVICPTQRSNGFTAIYIMQGNAEKMIKENYIDNKETKSCK